MKKAELVKTGLLKGNANLYKTDDGYIIVSRAHTFDHGDEVMAFKANSEGEVTNWSDLYCARAENGDDLSHEKAITSLGYIIY